MPFSVWRGDGLRLDRYAAGGPREVYYSIVQSPKTQEWVSAYPVVTPLLVTPLYAPTLWVDAFRPDHPRWGGVVRVLSEKAAASLICAAAIALFFLALRRHLSAGVSLAFSLLLAFATPVWSLSSQSLWPHGTAQLLLCVALYVLSEPSRDLSRGGLVGLGLVAGLLTANRPQDLPWSAAIAGIVLLRTGRRSAPFWLASASVAMLLAAYNLRYFTSIKGAYGDWAKFGYADIPFRVPDANSLAGLWLSTRGLLFACPFLLWAALLWRRRPRDPQTLPGREVLVCVGALIAFWLFHAAYPYWGGGYTYGPRYMSDALPVLVAGAVPALLGMRLLVEKAAFGVCVAWALFFQGVGAFAYPAGDRGHEQHGVWRLARASVLVAAAHGPAAPHYLSAFLPESWIMSQPLRPEQRSARLEWLEPPPETARPLEVVSFKVAARVGPGESWSSLGGPLGGFGARWRANWKRDDGQVDLGADAWLGLRVGPGERTEKTLRLVAPVHPGRYRLSIEPAQFAFHEWLSLSAAGSGPLVAEVDVRPRVDGD
jgi:hypothetical protein